MMKKKKEKKNFKKVRKEMLLKEMIQMWLDIPPHFACEKKKKDYLHFQFTSKAI